MILLQTIDLRKQFGETRACDGLNFIVQKGENLPALPTIAALGKNTTWGTQIESRNVLFLPKGNS